VVTVTGLGGELASTLVEWALTQVGLSGLVGAGALLSVAMYLWWGFKLHTLAGVAKGVGLSAAKTGGLALVLTLAILGWLTWEGVIPSIRLGVLVDTVNDLLVGVVP
jgi:hypothetical protein